MMKGILGKKLGMTQFFDENGEVIPVTVIEAGPCYITQKKTTETDGYSAIQLGFGEIPEQKLNKPEAGHLAKSNSSAVRYLREFQVSDSEAYEEGQKIEALY